MNGLASDSAVKTARFCWNPHSISDPCTETSWKLSQNTVNGLASDSAVKMQDTDRKSM